MEDPLLRDLSPLEERSLSLTGSLGLAIVDSFRKRAYRIDVHILPYFMASHYSEFCDVALQFFDREIPSGCVLELYVHHGFAVQVHDFLTKIGYVLTPRWGNGFADVNCMLADMVRSVWDEFPSRRPPSFSDPGIVGVFPYQNADGAWIEVRTMMFCALQAVLNFPATCIMNIITYAHAVSLYPHTTFIEHVAF
ncbi:uncharacterized protein EV420DRAFT_1645665 [Desarmillaria tabescens]|uniref:Uncharacterized protein n=1 Tax=Armillaria tabescens TaxID=1929756 RepID=A0AA39K1D9_ARMTA|nr:uncharacterized protein EV420DRAFT_1645665 [Desarmillaria tabescens]KAK0452812.1 hypothetical protein EV420DRAFT_1645665 [Desarmillaria tabescens]